MASQEKSEYIQYPECQDQRTGCKVSWLYYDSKEDAEKACIAARSNARLYAALGYDYGYQAPGYQAEWAVPGNWPQAGDKGRWQVCIP